MRVIRIALYACMAIVLAGGWAFLYWQSSGLELDAANGARGALNGLRAIAARWNDQLVGAREEKPALAKRFAAARAELARRSPDAEGDDLKRAELTAAAQALFDQAWLPPPPPRGPPPR